MSAGKKTVLVVDDDRAVRESLKFDLELEGLVVETFDCGASLLRDARLAGADCVVLDCKMPGMDGFAVLGELAARGITAPVILITAPLTETLRRRAKKAEVFAILEKPLLDDILIQNVRSAAFH
jgi:two-component system, LuxR family, response regulator FixJ